MKNVIRSIQQFDEVAAEIEKLPLEMDRIAKFCDCFLSREAVPAALLNGDPFSESYFDACKGFLVSLTGTDGYTPSVNEGSAFLDQFGTGNYVPAVYRYNDSRNLGDAFIAA